MTSILNFTAYAGASWDEQVTWSGQNISARAITMNLRRKRGATAALVLTEGNGRITVTAPSTGEFTINLSATETAALSGEYVYELTLAEDADATSAAQLIRGILNVIPS